MSQPPLDCFAAPDERIALDAALRLLHARAAPCVGSERVRLRDAVGRYLAQPVQAARDVPAFANAAVDGYAFAHASLAGGRRLRLLVGRAAAGHPFAAAVPAGSCLRVLTGAPMPAGTDTVALQEHVRRAGDAVEIPDRLPRGANRRMAGEDIAAGSVVLLPGRRLGPAELGVLAELGLAEVEVFRPLRVALLSSGDELLEPGTELRAGGVFDANRYILQGLLASLPTTIADLGIVADDASAVRAALAAASARYDVIITSGGASRGDEDHVVREAKTLGRLDFWQIALKPGRPLAIGRLGAATFVGLPGNPVAAMICFLLLARPLLARLAGGSWPEPRRHPVRAGFALAKQPGRAELLRVRLAPDADGGWVATSVPRQGSGVLTSMIEADGLAELAAERTAVAPGDRLPFLSFAELLAR